MRRYSEAFFLRIFFLPLYTHTYSSPWYSRLFFTDCEQIIFTRRLFKNYILIPGFSQGFPDIFFFFFKDKSWNLSKIVSVLLSASVRRFFVSCKQDFFFSFYIYFFYIWCFYPHRSRDSVPPVCGIFNIEKEKVPHTGDTKFHNADSSTNTRPSICPKFYITQISVDK